MTEVAVCTAELGQGWRVCPTCPTDDNVWPVESFGAWERAARGKPIRPICDACLFSRYPRSYMSCSTCGGLMFFRPDRKQHPHPQCRRCVGLAVPACMNCRASLEGRSSIGGLCPGCSEQFAAPEVACA